ncbi:aminopeptidase P family protein [Lutimaribacter sp. EGI FJ00015]|uniref:Aminopeptidase P family protein n=1 Tax=Lutimaribacter degradans TaxID=2945989 RepID=A0ACC5ZR28_9RHOB|nr:aminopeptidase P family protein [Lutimaribacter sp. EGI FJ00013]MCM2560717.1 aminopeptidase P family protein [Lutimaribacter sp. EGI FJ00013]MCO0612338.1 aminopeptidase P family protein [Lutimaribacter sp. EGI FJ00015]MCO0634542.1 aminopeptidase P family protein [Lutimaribacter sp. EGI FJ00014]
MFQSFDTTASPEYGPARLAQLRQQMQGEGLAGFLVPRADAHQGEYVAPHDARLEWLTGFTGSAGFCIALRDVAGVFVDGRYRTQVKHQVDTGAFTPVDWPETQPAPWLRQHLDAGRIGFDPWLHTPGEIARIEKGLQGSGISLAPCPNLVDRIWPDQPEPPTGKITPYPQTLAGEAHTDKLARLGATLRNHGQSAAVITLPDSLAWLLNVRGSDIPRNPIPHGFAILHDSGQATLFTDAAKVDEALRAHLGEAVTLRPVAAFAPALRSLGGPVRVDHDSAPIWVLHQLDEAGVPHEAGQDPCILPKATKTRAEIAATREAHLRDAAAMCEFLCWFDAQPPGTITEIDVATQLEGFRRASNELLDISFDTIAGTGPHGAIMHYRVTHDTNATLEDGQLIVLDSGGQYLDGTTDITRTLPVGHVGEEEKTCFTRVLKGLIAISRLRFPRGLAGRDLDAIARYPLWVAGQDFNHGTGHGVGVYMCVHEGPQRLSRMSEVALQPGMILSNEPGYYREGAFGIRLENLIVVQEAPDLPGADPRPMHDFETLTFVPIDRRLVMPALLGDDERDWLNAYHAECRDKIAPRLSDEARLWLQKATAPI